MMSRVEMNEAMMEQVVGGEDFVDIVKDSVKQAVDEVIIQPAIEIYEPVKKMWDWIFG